MDELNLDLDQTTGQEDSEEIVLGVVAAVTSDGVQIQVDGNSTAGEKEYKVNSSILFQAGDRVKLEKNSGTYIVEYVVGSPMERYPFPSGGSDGQMLVKDGSNPYQIKWATPPTGIPSGGTKGAVLCKNSATDYDVTWVAKGLPAEGTTGQVLCKNSASSYDVSWKTIDTVPSTGTTGYVLTKTATGCSWQAAPTELPDSGTTGYVLTKTATGCSWQAVPTPTVTVDRLTSGANTFTLSSTVLTPSGNGTISIGDASHYINDFRQSGNAYIGYSSTAKNIYLGYSGNSKIGFFGATPVVRKTVANNATVATLITALKGYGLIA